MEKPILELYNEDCLEALRKMPDNSVDSLVTDAPAGIAFMGKSWDEDKGGRNQWIAWLTEILKEARRILKPGAHGLVWALPRTSHWTATACEDAGFDIREKVLHLFGSGFPKSLNVNKELQNKGLACVCCEDLQSLPENVDSENSISGHAQSNLQSELCEQTSAPDSSDTNKARSNLSGLQENFSAQEQPSFVESQNVWVPVSGHSSKAERTDQAFEGNSSTWQKGLDSRVGRGSSGKNDGSKQSCLEGRGHFQTEQRELHRSEVCALSEGIVTHGAERRLCDGTSTSDGSTPRTLLGENRGGQFGTFSEQPRAQTCRSCRKAKIQAGLGTALKPAVEEWILVRKPLGEKTVAANVLKHGTGALNVDASRVGTEQRYNQPAGNKAGGNSLNLSVKGMPQDVEGTTAIGRFPANLVLSHNDDCDDTCTDECAVAALDAQSGVSKSTAGVRNNNNNQGHEAWSNGSLRKGPLFSGHQDSGGASRFFYVAKASKKDKGVGNTHPTVKSTALMTYLIKLITPPNGIVLDPFMGSGSTGVAALENGFGFIGIEKEQEYFETCEFRIATILMRGA